MTDTPRPSLRGADVVVPRPTVAAVVVDGQAVLYDEDSKMLHLLDPIGSVVWQCLDGTGTLAEIEADLADVYGMPIRQIRTDVRRLIRRLDKLELVDGVAGRRVTPPTTAHHEPSPAPRILDEPPNP